jgi:sirohydrochlorin cobaltochelatase
MQLKKEGFVVDTYLHGLGENAEIQKIYVQHIQAAIAGEEDAGH